MINPIYIDNLIKEALLEDINYIDTATDYLIDDEQCNEAVFMAKADGIVCGVGIAMRVFEIINRGKLEYNVLKRDGEQVKYGDIIAEVKGSTRTLLKGERTALNLIQHMSGIATATNEA
ncbi:MAG: nicotinate-nucleotide diphosphorylase, partial [Acutalibacteraceae bacterium]